MNLTGLVRTVKNHRLILSSITLENGEMYLKIEDGNNLTALPLYCRRFTDSQDLVEASEIAMSMLLRFDGTTDVSSLFAVMTMNIDNQLTK